jgi:5'-3' exonuclease
MQYDVIIVDASYLGYSSWWHCRTLTTNKGGEIIYTGLEFGFIKNFLAHTRNNHPAKPYFAWDGAPKRGLALNPEYKGNRDKSSHAHEQPWGPRFERLREHWQVLVPSLYHPDKEADEHVAHFVALQESQGKTTLIVGNDGDFYQLVSEKTHLFPGGEDKPIFTPETVQKQWGVPPHKVPFYRAIDGDKSDNLNRVPYISDETKVQLALEATSIDNLVELFHTASYVKPTQRKRLIENAKLVRQNFSIMNLRDLAPQVDIPILPHGTDSLILGLCKELELNSLLDRKEWELLKKSE